MAIDDRSRENEEVDSYNEEEQLSETFGEDIYVHMAKIAPSEGEDGGLEDLDYRASSLSDKIDELNQKLNFLCNECVTREELENLKHYFLGNGTSIISNHTTRQFLPKPHKCRDYKHSNCGVVFLYHMVLRVT